MIRLGNSSVVKPKNLQCVSHIASGPGGSIIAMVGRLSDLPEFDYNYEISIYHSFFGMRKHGSVKFN